MALPDLLWACPLCGLDRGLRTGKAPGTCAGCGTRFERVRGARIRAVPPEGPVQDRTAAEWLADLPDPASLLKSPTDVVRVARATARFVEREEVVRHGATYLNRIEIWGPDREGRLQMAPESLSWTEPSGEPVTWPFGDLRAVQASSRTIQLRGAEQPLASFSFLDDSSFLWEQLLHRALSASYQRTGRGRILELQPRIVTG